MAPQLKAKSAAVPTVSEPAVGDKSSKGPLNHTVTNTDKTLCLSPHPVQPTVPNKNIVDPYIANSNSLETKASPFIQTVGLKGENGILTNMRGLFNDGAMVNSLCKSTYTSLRNNLGTLVPSSKQLRMANGTIVPSTGKWTGNVHLGSRTVKSSFEVFPSGGGWSLLVGKPLLKQLKAVHKYETDTIELPRSDGTFDVLTNTHNEKHPQPKREDNTITPAPNSGTPNTKSRGRRVGQRGRTKKRRARDKAENDVNTVQTTENNNPTDDGVMQPEIEIGGDKSIFTRLTNPFKPERVAEILKLVKIGPDLSNTQRDRVTALIAKYADCFALSIREVIAIPGAEHRIKIPSDAMFPKKIPHQKPLEDNRRSYLNNAIDELLTAGIIETIRPEDIKCCSPITLAQKAHDKPGLSLNELKHRVNEQCISGGMAPKHDIEARDNKEPPPTKQDPTKPQTWRICQNYSALNKVTQVFPTPAGDIRTKQRKLSGHRWVHKFDFASGFYAVSIPVETRPFLAFYTENRGFLTQKRMPFGLTGSPSTFHHITAECLGDLLPKIGMELVVDDSGMAGNEFEDVMKRTHLFLQRIRDKSMSLSAKKSELFMSEVVFAGSRVGTDGVLPDATKLTAVVDWRQPPDLLNLSSFLGLTGYFRDLIKGYAKKALPLTDLIRSASIPKGAGKATYRALLRRIKLPNIWSKIHQDAFMELKTALTSEPVLKAPRFDGSPFIVTSDGCKEGFGAILAQRFPETRKGDKIVEKRYPIAYASKRTSPSEAKYKPYLLEFAGLKFGLDKFDDIIWGSPVEIETDCQALRDILLNDDLNATHAWWRDGVIAHQIVDVRHIPGKANLVGDGLSRKDEANPRIEGDGSSWSVTPDWENARGLEYDLFSVSANPDTLHNKLRTRFKDERVFVEVVDAILGVTGATTENERRRAAHRAVGYFIEGRKLWKIGGFTPERATARRECITKSEAVTLAKAEHSKLHMHCDVIRNQLLNQIISPFLDTSITTAILECGKCKNFGSTHLHSLLAPITRRKPFELLVGDYLSMPTGKGGFTKIGLYVDVFSQKMWAFKSKAARGKDTVNSLRRITQAFTAPTVFMADGGGHFDCEEVKTFCEEMNTHLHIIAAYSPWVNGLLEGSNGILLNALKRLCAPNLGEDDYERMEKEDTPRNWPDHLDSAIKNLSDRILPALKFSPNELLLGIPTTIPPPVDPNTITPPTEADVALHLAITEQLRFDGYASMVNHAEKRKQKFDEKVMKNSPGNVIFEPGDLVQIHQTQWTHTFTSIRKLIPMWSTPHRVTTRLRNSYTLETLNNSPIAGRFSARRLRLFTPRPSTKLALNELE